MGCAGHLFAATIFIYSDPYILGKLWSFTCEHWNMASLTGAAALKLWNHCERNCATVATVAAFEASRRMQPNYASGTTMKNDYWSGSERTVPATGTNAPTELQACTTFDWIKIACEQHFLNKLDRLLCRGMCVRARVCVSVCFVVVRPLYAASPCERCKIRSDICIFREGTNMAAQTSTHTHMLQQTALLPVTMPHMQHWQKSSRKHQGI